MLAKAKALFEGKKKYVAAAIVGVIAAVQYLGYSVPSWVPMVLSAVGLA
jgi:hypothetical protein